MKPDTEASRPSGLALLEDENFVWSCIWPLVSAGETKPRGTAFELAVHRRREDGRAVAEYSFAGAPRVFAKVYPDDAAGRAVYRIHDELCRRGFGPGSPYRVPRPLAYLREHPVLVVGAAPGEPLGTTLTRDWQAFEEAVLRSARWLAALHTSAVAVGPREEVADGASRLAGRVEKAAAARPDLGEALRGALGELERRYGTAGARRLVQTHGRYHGAHVFVAPECVTAIDLDRAALADPAKDVGEFVASLSWVRTLGLVHQAEVDEVCKSFLGEYAAHGPGVPDELSYYWSYVIVWALARQAFKDRPERRRWRERLDRLQSELDAVPARVAAWLG